MDKEQLFNDGVYVLQMLLAKYIEEKMILENEKHKYFLKYAGSADLEECLYENLPKKVINFSIYFSNDDENAEKIEVVGVSLEENLKICKYDSNISLTDSKKVSDLKHENNVSEIENIAELYYIAKTMKRNLENETEYRKSYEMYNQKIANMHVEENQIIQEATDKQDDKKDIIEEKNLNEEDIKVDTIEYVEKTADDTYNELIKRLDAGNSEKKSYNFKWDKTNLLNYADDSSLELAYNLLERGRFVLEYNDKQILIKTYIKGLCNYDETNEQFFEKYNENNKYAEIEEENVWKINIEDKEFNYKTCINCKYQSCPKILASYILYLKNNGLLKKKLEEREEFRKNNNVANGFFAFELKNKNGLKKINDETFEFANELVNRNLIRVCRHLYKEDTIKIEELFSCDDVKISGLNIENLPSDEYSWDNFKFLTRNTKFEPENFCNPYDCRMPACPITVAAYIYYLKMSGQECKIKEDREYYNNHKEEIDKEIAERIAEKIGTLNTKAEEKLQSFKEKYNNKIENFDNIINSIMVGGKTNFHSIIIGEDEDETSKFIENVIELLKYSTTIKNVRKMSAVHFARLHYHFTPIRINRNGELKYGDRETSDDKNIGSMCDVNGVPYAGDYYKANRRNSLEEDTIYILDGIREFVDDFMYYSQSNYYFDRKMMMNAVDVLTDMSSNKYVILKAKKDEVESFIDLDARLKFVYKNNMIEIPTQSIDEMYMEYLRNLNGDLIQKLKECEEEYKKQFNEFVSMNQRFMPFSKSETVSYLATFANTKNELVFPPNIYKKETLDNIVGLGAVKEKLKEFEKYMLFQIQAKANDIKIASSNMHMIFTGNPGTGKTTVARIMAKMLFDLGVVKENKLIEVERKDLVAAYVGQTAIKTADVIDKAMGGVLFVDEAYSLSNGHGGTHDYGAEAVATLIKAMEDHKGEFVVIFAGYRDEMKKFTDINPGIASRIGYTFDFPDYTENELMEIFYLKLKNSGFEVDETVETPLRRLCSYFSKRKNFGNGRFIDKVIQETLMNHALKDDNNIKKIIGDEIPTIEELMQQFKDKNSDTAEEMLSGIVGLENLKKEILDFGDYISFVKEAEKQKIKIPDSNMHMIFTGNPGTGKTTVARIIAKLLFDMEVIHENKLVEVERKDLVAVYSGQTGPKTSEVVERAMGGVLFVDEAYSLSGDYLGAEAIATLIKAMEDHKGEFVVIFAGYKKEMKEFVNTNPGIASRIGYTFDFEDYGPEELQQIFVKKVEKTGMTLEEDANEAVLKVMRYFSNVENFGNGRFVDKVFTQTIKKHSKQKDKDISIIAASDIPEINEMTKLMLGGDRMIDVARITEDAYRRTAVHEIGHAAARYLLTEVPGIKKITINAEGTGTLGYVEYNGGKGSYMPRKTDLLNRIKVNLAGLACEKIYYGEYASGGTSDIEHATNTAKQMITTLGMSELGFAKIINPTGEIAMAVLNEENKILTKCFDEVTTLLSENKEKIDRTVEYLVEHKEINEEEFIKVFEGK